MTLKPSRGTRRSLAAATAALITAAAVAACNAHPGGSAGAGGSGGDDAIRFGYLKATLGTVLYKIATVNDDFRKNKLTITDSTVAQGQSSLGAVGLLQGRYDAYLGVPADIANVVAQAVSKGQKPPVAIIAAGAGAGHLVLKKSAKLDSPEDLRGLKIGVPSLSSGYIPLFDTYLDDHGTSLKQLGIQLVAVKAGQTPAALAAGAIDGFLGAQPTVATAVIKDGAHDVLTGKAFCDQCGDVPADALGVRTDWLAKHHDEAVRLVKAFQDASSQYKSTSKDDMVKIYADYVGGEPDVNSLAYDSYDPSLLPLTTARDAYWGVVGKVFQENGQYPTNLTADDIFDTSLSS